MLHNCIARASQLQSTMAECGLIDDVTARAPLCHCHSYIRSFIRGSGWRHTSHAHRSALYPSTISTLELQRRPDNRRSLRKFQEVSSEIDMQLGKKEGEYKRTVPLSLSLSPLCITFSNSFPAFNIDEAANNSAHFIRQPPRSP